MFVLCYDCVLAVVFFVLPLTCWICFRELQEVEVELNFVQADVRKKETVLTPSFVCLIIRLIMVIVLDAVLLLCHISLLVACGNIFEVRIIVSVSQYGVKHGSVIVILLCQLQLAVLVIRNTFL